MSYKWIDHSRISIDKDFENVKQFKDIFKQIKWLVEF